MDAPHCYCSTGGDILENAANVVFAFLSPSSSFQFSWCHVCAFRRLRPYPDTQRTFSSRRSSRPRITVIWLPSIGSELEHPLPFATQIAHSGKPTHPSWMTLPFMQMQLRSYCYCSTGGDILVAAAKMSSWHFLLLKLIYVFVMSCLRFVLAVAISGPQMTFSPRRSPCPRILVIWLPLIGSESEGPIQGWIALIYVVGGKIWIGGNAFPPICQIVNLHALKQ